MEAQQSGYHNDSSSQKKAEMVVQYASKTWLNTLTFQVYCILFGNWRSLRCNIIAWATWMVFDSLHAARFLDSDSVSWLRLCHCGITTDVLCTHILDSASTSTQPTQG